VQEKGFSLVSTERISWVTNTRQVELGYLAWEGDIARLIGLTGAFVSAQMLSALEQFPAKPARRYNRPRTHIGPDLGGKCGTEQMGTRRETSCAWGKTLAVGWGKLGYLNNHSSSKILNGEVWNRVYHVAFRD
jgi:hypothetical protein